MNIILTALAVIIGYAASTQLGAAEEPPQWIGSHAQVSKESRKEFPTARYRHGFKVDGKVVTAQWEGHGTVYLNGGEISVVDSRIVVDPGLLKVGENQIGIVSKAGSQQHRVMGRLTIGLEGGGTQVVQTGSGAWVMQFIAKKAPQEWGWLEQGHDESDWQAVALIEGGANGDWETVASALIDRVALWSVGRGPISPDETEPANAYVQVFRPRKPNGTAMVVCAGGGYGMNLWYGLEGVGTGKWLSKHGVTAAVLIYRLPRGNHYRTHADVKRAMQWLRSQGGATGMPPKQVGIIGYSAGGHLASTASTRFDAGNAAAKDPLARVSSRPDFAILVYPVITLGEFTHEGTRKGWLGVDPGEEAVKQFSSDLQVTAQTPPTFLTHPQDDDMVPPINSQRYYEALQKHGVEAEYLRLPAGGHGFRLLEGGMGGKNWEPWQTAALAWMKQHSFLPGTGDESR